MPKIKRNDPCICGSGKKYKKCCEKAIVQRSFQFSKEEWEEEYTNLLPRLVSYLRKDKFKNDYKNALDMFFPDRDTIDDELEDDEELLFMVFLINCYRFSSPKKTLIELFLDEYSSSLLPAERVILKNMLMGKWRIFKVLDKDKENYNRIQDVFNDEIIQITSVDKIILSTNKIYTGLTFQMDGDHYFSGIVTNIIEEKLDLVMSTMMDEFHQAEETGESIEFSLFLKYNAHRILQLIGYNNKLKIQNRDGSTIKFWSIVFEILNHEKFVESIKNDSMIRWDDDNYFTWLIKGKTAEMLEYDVFKLTEPFTVFGSGRVEGNLLFIEVNSTDRMEVAVDYLTENYVEELEFVDAKYLGDIHSYKPQEKSGESDIHDDVLSEEEKYELEMHYLKDFYYNKWLYDPIPVLDYLSPVEAFEKNPEEFEVLLKGINNRPGEIDINDLRKHIAKHAEIEREYQYYKNLQLEMVQNVFAEYLRDENNIELSDRYKDTIEPYCYYVVLYNDTLRVGEVVEIEDSTVIVCFNDDDYRELNPSDFYYRLSDDEEYQLDLLYDEQAYQADFTINFLRKTNSGTKYTPAVFGFHKVLFGVFDFVKFYLKETDETITCMLREYSGSFPYSKYYFKDKQMDISAMEFFQALLFPDRFFSFNPDLSKKLSKDTAKTDRVVWYICYLFSKCLYTHESHKTFDINDPKAPSYIEEIYNRNVDHIIAEIDVFLKIVNQKHIYKQFANYLTSVKFEL